MAGGEPPPETMTDAHDLACPDCRLTPVGGDVLSREVDRLRRTRPHGTWRAQVCQRCERVTHVFDLEEGWSLGAPAAGASFVLAPLPAPAVSLPEAVPEEVGEPAVAVPSGHPAAAFRASLGDSWAFAAR